MERGRRNLGKHHLSEPYLDKLLKLQIHYLLLINLIAGYHSIPLINLFVKTKVYLFKAEIYIDLLQHTSLGQNVINQTRFPIHPTPAQRREET